MTEFERQKAEAEQRVKEMNRRYNEKATSKPPETKPIQTAPKSTPFDIFKLLKLDNFRADSDRLLLLGLFLLLSSQEADELLLYALIYIMI